MSYGKRTDKHDSRLEQKVHRCLLRYFPGKHLLLHHPFVIRQPNLYFPRRRVWKPDFVLATLPPDNEFFIQSIYLIVEVKGRWLLKPHAGEQFKILLELISETSPKILDKLLIVGQDSFQVGTLQILEFQDAIQRAHTQLNQ